MDQWPRGDQHADSDLDLLVTPADEATLFDIAQFEMDMEVLIGVPVTAISVASLNKRRDAALLDEAVSL
ncbi:MAG: nucleotidyltransferase family protein [Microbacterium sp.]